VADILTCCAQYFDQYQPYNITRDYFKAIYVVMLFWDTITEKPKYM